MTKLAIFHFGRKFSRPATLARVSQVPFDRSFDLWSLRKIVIGADVARQNSLGALEKNLEFGISRRPRQFGGID